MNEVIKTPDFLNEIGKKLQSASELEEKYEPYDDIFDEVNNILHIVFPNQKDRIEYSTQNTDDEKVTFLSTMATISYEWLEDYPKAYKYYEELDNLVLGHAKIRKGLGDSLRSQGNHKDAILKYSDALVNYFHEPKFDASILNCRALSHLELFYKSSDSETKISELELARKDLDKAAENDSENVLYLCNLGKVLDLQGEREEALEIYQKAHDLIMVERFGEGFEEEDRKFFKEILPLLIEFKISVKASEDIFSSDKNLSEWIIQENQEANETLNFEQFKAEYRKRMFRQATNDKKKNLELLEKLLNQLVQDRKYILKQKQEKLIAERNKIKTQEKLLEMESKNISKKELQIERNYWKKKIYDLHEDDEDERKKLIDYFEVFSRILEFISTTFSLNQLNQGGASSFLDSNPSDCEFSLYLSLMPAQILKDVSSTQKAKICEIRKKFWEKFSNLGNEAQLVQKIGETTYNIVEDPAYQKKILKPKAKKFKEYSDELMKKVAEIKNKFPRRLSDRLEKLFKTPAATLGNRDASLLLTRWDSSKKICKQDLSKELARMIVKPTLGEKVRGLLEEVGKYQDNPYKFEDIFKRIHKKLVYEQKEIKSVRLSIDKTDIKMAYWCRRAEVFYNGLDDYENALKCYEELYELDPEHSKILKGLGDCNRKLGKHEVALEHYDAALKTLSEDEENSSLHAGVLNNKALSLIELERVSEAIKALKDAIDKDSQNPLYYVTLAKLLYDQNKIEDALNFLNQADKLLNQSSTSIHPANEKYIKTALPRVFELIRYRISLNTKESPKKEENDVKLQKINEAIKEGLSLKIISKQKEVTKPKSEAERKFVEEKNRVFNNKIKNVIKLESGSEIEEARLQFQERMKTEIINPNEEERLLECYDGISTAIDDIFTTSTAIFSENANSEIKLIERSAVPTTILCFSEATEFNEPHENRNELLKSFTIEEKASRVKSLGTTREIQRMVSEAIFNIFRSQENQKRIPREEKEVQEVLKKAEKITDIEVLKEFSSSPAAQFGFFIAVSVLDKLLKDPENREQKVEEWTNQMSILLNA